jgi:hypothetical protein
MGFDPSGRFITRNQEEDAGWIWSAGPSERDFNRSARF